MRNKVVMEIVMARTKQMNKLKDSGENKDKKIKIKQLEFTVGTQKGNMMDSCGMILAQDLER